MVRTPHRIVNKSGQNQDAEAIAPFLGGIIGICCLIIGQSLGADMGLLGTFGFLRGLVTPTLGLLNSSGDGGVVNPLGFAARSSVSP